jgi:hypothetical protein
MRDSGCMIIAIMILVTDGAQKGGATGATRCSRVILAGRLTIGGPGELG